MQKTSTLHRTLHSVLGYRGMHKYINRLSHAAEYGVRTRFCACFAHFLSLRARFSWIIKIAKIAHVYRRLQSATESIGSSTKILRLRVVVVVTCPEKFKYLHAQHTYTGEGEKHRQTDRQTASDWKKSPIERENLLSKHSADTAVRGADGVRATETQWTDK